MRCSAWTVSPWKSTRGAATASSGDMPWSTRFSSVCSTPFTIRVPPGAPSTTAGRPRAHDPAPAAVGARDGRDHPRLVPGQVLARDEAAVGREVRRDRLRDLAAVEVLRAGRSEPLVRPGQVRVLDRLAERVQPAG